MTGRDERGALKVVCPNCQAKAGEPCTQPNDLSRRPVKRPHWSRIARAENQVDR